MLPLATAPPAGLGPRPRLLSPLSTCGARLVPSEVVTGPALVGRSVLFYWQTDGWVRGMVASGTTVGRRWALLWLIRSLMPRRTAPGGGGRGPGPSLEPADRHRLPGRAGEPGREERTFRVRTRLLP